MIATPEGTNKQQADVVAEKRQRDISTRCSGHDKTSKLGHLLLLPRRGLGKATGKDHDEFEVCWVEDKFVLPSNDELAANNNEGGECCHGEVVAVEQKAPGQG